MSDLERPEEHGEKIINSILDRIVGGGWEPFFDVSKLNIDLTEDEVVAQFFLGLFPDNDDLEDLSLEISTLLEDIQVHARAKANEQIVQFCEFFADHSEELASDLLAIKKRMGEKVNMAYEEEALNAKKLAETIEGSGFVSPSKQIHETSVRFGNGVGIFRRYNDVDCDYEFTFVPDEKE